MTHISRLKIGDRVVVDTHRPQGKRYENGAVTGLSAPGWVYYRPDDRDTIKATDPSNVITSPLPPMGTESGGR